MKIDQKVRIIHGAHSGNIGTVAFLYPKDDTVVVRVIGNMLAVDLRMVMDAEEWPNSQERQYKIADQTYFRWQHHGGDAADNWLWAEAAVG